MITDPNWKYRNAEQSRKPGRERLWKAAAKPVSNVATLKKAVKS